ncbi:hypothetical protein Ancab_035895 [Ancistrocladus abbreviatus]
MAKRVYHIAYERDDYDDFDRYEALSKAKSVQSILHVGSSFQQYYLSDRAPREILPELGPLRLPDDMWKLSSLRCLAILGSNVDEMPKQLSMLEKLHSLDVFAVGKAGGSHLAELRGLQRLRGRLRIKGLENVANVDDVREVGLKEMGDLDDLAFEFDCSRTNNFEKERDVLENLRPNANLEKLTISYYGATSFQS